MEEPRLEPLEGPFWGDDSWWRPGCPVGLRPPSLSVLGYVLKGLVVCWAVFITPSVTGRLGVRMLGPDRGLLSLGDWGLPSRVT